MTFYNKKIVLCHFKMKMYIPNNLHIKLLLRKSKTICFQEIMDMINTCSAPQ